MNRLARMFCSVTIGCTLAAHAAPASAQEPARSQGPGARGGGGRGAAPLEAAADALNRLREVERSYNLALRASVAEPVVRDAPYSGEGVTTVTQVLADGTRIERMTTTRVWRDRMGRVRREQSAVGFDWLNPPNDSKQVVTITDPVANVTYTLDAANRTARTALLAARRVTRAAPSGAALESLPPRQINGLKVTGTRTTSTIPTGQIGNDRPIAVTDENWESPELQVLVESRQSDPRTGVVEYRLTNINRAEPPPDLFVVPSDYTVIRQGFPVVPGVRGVAPGTGGGGRGGRSNSVDQFGPPPEN